MIYLYIINSDNLRTVTFLGRKPTVGAIFRDRPALGRRGNESGARMHRRDALVSKQSRRR